LAALASIGCRVRFRYTKNQIASASRKAPSSPARTKVMVRNMGVLEEDGLDESEGEDVDEPDGTAVAGVTVVEKNPISEVEVSAVVLVYRLIRHHMPEIERRTKW
jgi:hypothetical protein